MPLCVCGVQVLVLNLLHHVWYVIVSAIGNGGSQIGYLERCEVDLSLSDGDAYDRQTIPAPPVGLVVELGIGYHASLLSWQVNAQLVTESHGDHIVLPSGHGFLDALVFLSVAEHVIQSPAEVSVAGGGYGRSQVQGRGVSVASHLEVPEAESVTARKGG